MTDESLETADRTASASPISLTPIFLGLLWLATSAWTARASYTGGAEPDGALGDAIGSIPSTVAATMFTSATIASAVGARFPRVLPRLLAGLGAGIGFGLVAAVATRFGYGDGESITVVALVIGAAGVAGGMAAALPHAVLEAGLWGTTWVLFAGVISLALGVSLAATIGGRVSALNEGARAIAGGNLAARVEVREDPALEADFPATRAARVEAALRDGRRLERLVDLPDGMPERPASPAALQAKFSGLAEPLVGRPAAAALLDLTLQGGPEPVSTLLTHTVPAAPPG